MFVTASCLPLQNMNDYCAPHFTPVFGQKLPFLGHLNGQQNSFDPHNYKKLYCFEIETTFVIQENSFPIICTDTLPLPAITHAQVDFLPLRGNSSPKFNNHIVIPGI